MGRNIKHIAQKIKAAASRFLADDRSFLTMFLLCLCLVSFGLGRLSATYSVQSTSRITQIAGVTEPEEAKEDKTIPANAKQRYVASKNSDKYHLPWCSGAQRIAERNKIWFASAAEAQAAGYTPAANCKGL